VMRSCTYLFVGVEDISDYGAGTRGLRRRIS
jgi:hypothetical protein